ncbi:MAG TPA: sugar ABC transporter permease [Solimonas sp.]
MSTRLLQSPLLLLAPLALGLGVLLVLPALAGLLLAFTDYDGVSPPRWIGLENLRAMSRDPLFSTALWNSLWVALFAVPLRLGLALGLALALQRRSGLAAGAVFLPTAVPDVAWALLWLWIANPFYGPLAWLLAALGWRPDLWLLDPVAAKALLVLITLFLIGELFVVLLAARREIPPALYDAALLEGASAGFVFRRLTLPLLVPALLFLGARDIALSLQTTFTPALVVTKGGPNYATLMLPLYAYQTGFEYLRLGLAAAQTLTMLGLTLAMMAVQTWALRRWRALGL